MNYTWFLSLRAASGHMTTWFSIWLSRIPYRTVSRIMLSPMVSHSFPQSPIILSLHVIKIHLVKIIEEEFGNAFSILVGLNLIYDPKFVFEVLFDRVTAFFHYFYVVTEELEGTLSKAYSSFSQYIPDITWNVNICPETRDL